MKLNTFQGCSGQKLKIIYNLFFFFIITQKKKINQKKSESVSTMRNQ